MSAHVVSKIHIDLLVSAGIAFGDGNGIRWNGNDIPSAWESRYATYETADRTGRMLWTSNVASVAYRYPDDVSGERPGPAGFTDSEAETYRFERIPGYITPLAVLSALSSYEYQTCENAMGWHNSEAKRYCDALRIAAIRRIPGYGDHLGATDDRQYFVAMRSTQ